MGKRIGLLLLALLVSLAGFSPAMAKGAGYKHYAIGDLKAPIPGRHGGGLLLMGGGDRNHDAMKWFFAHAGGGHIVILRASYGGEIGKTLDSAPRVPTLLHFGEQDHAIPLSVAEGVSARYPWVPVHVYPAGHGFNCDERGSFHPESAVLALRRTVGLLRAVF